MMARSTRIHIEHFRWRVLQDALAEATSAYWLHRARMFEDVGNERCAAVALACRRHARLVRFQTPPELEEHAG